MSEKLSIVHEWRTINITKPHSALVQTVLLEACTAFKIADPSSVKLVVEKGEKAIDHSLSIRVANLKAANKLALVKASPSRSSQVSVTVAWKDVVHTDLFPLTASLWDVLEKIEASGLAPPARAAQTPSPLPVPAAASATQRWTGWEGIPEPEVNAQFEVHIHVAGWMAPVVEIGSAPARRIQGEAELRSTQLLHLGVQSDTPAPGKLRVKLSHAYQAPKRSEAEQKEVMDNFQRKYAQMMGGGSGAASSSSTAAAPASTVRAQLTSTTVVAAFSSSSTRVRFSDEEEGSDIDVDAEDDSPAPAPAVIPPDRRLQLLHALPGMLPAPELPDEFYEITDEDSLAYARAIRAEAHRLNRGAKPATELPLEASEEAIAAAKAKAARAEQEGDSATAAGSAASASSAAAAAAPASGGLMDSSRLPALPSRSARRKRACTATLLRVRLPNHLYVEGLFRADETPADLYKWMDSLLLLPQNVSGAAAAASASSSASAPAASASSASPAASAAPSSEFYLYITPPRQQLSRSSRLTFSQLGLLPQALVHYGSPHQTREQVQGQGGYTVVADTPEQVAAKEANPAVGLLRPEYVERVRKILPPAPAPAAAAATTDSVTAAGAPASATTSQQHEDDEKGGARMEE